MRMTYMKQLREFLSRILADIKKNKQKKGFIFNYYLQEPQFSPIAIYMECYVHPKQTQQVPPVNIAAMCFATDLV